MESHHKRAFRALAAAGLLAGVVLSGCSSGALGDLVTGGPRPPAEADPEIELSSSDAAAPAEGGTLSVEVRNSGGGTLDWSASVDGSFARISGTSSGSGNGSVSVRFDANEGEERTVILTVRSSNAANSPQTLALTQEEAPPQPTLEATVSDFAIDSAGETLAIDLTVSAEDLEWQVILPDEDWVRIVGRDNGTGTGAVSVEVDANDGEATRSLAVTVQLTETPSVATTLNFSQAVAPPVRIEVNADRTAIPAAGGDAVVTVNLNSATASWSAVVDGSPPPEWVRLSRSGGTLTIQVQTNREAEERSFSVTVTSQNAVNSPQTLQFTQAAAVLPVLSLSADSYTVAADGQTIEITISFAGEGAADAEWTVAVDEDAGFVNLVGVASGTGNGAVSVEVGANPDQEQRGFFVVIASEDASSSPQTLNFSQAAMPPVEMTINADRTALPAEGGEAVITVSLSNASESWTAEIDGQLGWVQLNRSGNTLTVKAQANRITEGRSFSVTVSAESAENSPQTLQFTQEGAILPRITAQADSYNVDAAGGEIRILIGFADDAEVDWDAAVTVGMEFANIMGSANGTGNATLTVNIEANSETGQRSFELVIQSDGAVGSPQILRFVQAGAEAAEVQITSTSYTVGASGGAVSVTVSAGATVEWSAAVDSEFASILGSSSGTGNGAVTIEVDANEDDEQRSFEITVTPEGGDAQTLGFVQSAAATSIQLSATSYTVGASGGAVSVSVSAGATVEWSASASGDFAHILGSASGAGNGTLTVLLDANADQERRSFDMTVTPGVGEVQSLGFVQSAASAESSRVQLTASNYVLGSGGSTVTVSVSASSGVEWSASVSGSFAHLVGSSSGFGNGTLTIRVDENSTEDQRSFEVTATPAAGDAQAVGFVQDGIDATSARVRVSAASYIVTAVGSSITVNVMTDADAEWDAEITGDFAHLVGSSSGVGDGMLSIRVDANTDQERRSFEVTVTLDEGDTQTVSFVQEGTAAAILSVTVPDRMVPYTGGTVRIDVENTGSSRLDWTVSVAEDWASVSGAAGGANDGSAVVVIDENDAGQRSLVVTVTAEGASGSPQTIRITQAGAPEQPQSAARVTANKYFVSSVGEVITVSVDVTGSANLEWEVELVDEVTTCTARVPEEDEMGDPTGEYVEEERDRGDWVRILGAARGMGDGTFQLQVDPNDQEQKCSTVRFGFDVTVRFTDAPELDQTLYFSQDRAAVSGTSRLWVSTRNVAAGGETVDVHLTLASEDTRWTAELSEAFAQFVNAVTVNGDIDGTGSSVIQVRINSNTTSASRSVDLTVTLIGEDTDGDDMDDELTETFTQASHQSALSVADVSVAEDAGPMAFTVTLSPTSDSTVTVDYATSDGTATSPADYISTAGSLTFDPGVGSLQVSVPIVDDSENDPGETFTLTLSNASGAYIDDAEATGTISNTDPIPQAWLARFGRTSAVHVAEAIQWRLERRSAALSAPYSDARRAHPSARFRAARRRTTGLVGEMNRPHNGLASYPSSRGVLYSSDSANSPIGRLSAWARSSTMQFAGAEGELSIDGSVQTALLGLDAEHGRWLAGLALAHTEGTGGYGHVRANGGAITSHLTSINPYARIAINADTDLWGTVGFGTGTMVVVPEGSRAIETGIHHTMAALGGRGLLSARVAKAGVLQLALRSDAVISRTASEMKDNLSAAVGKAGRVRAMLEGTGSFRLGAFGAIKPSLTVGVRYDAGDAETGAGLEIGGGLAYHSGRWTVDAQAHSLAVHQDASYRERGYSASVGYRPGDDGRGVSLNVRSSWGLAASAVGTLWEPNGAALRAGPLLPQRQQTQLVFGYGLPALSGAAVMVPFIGIATGHDGQNARLGIRLKTLDWSSADLQIGVRQTPAGGRDYGLALRWIVPL